MVYECLPGSTCDNVDGLYDNSGGLYGDSGGLYGDSSGSYGDSGGLYGDSASDGRSLHGCSKFQGGSRSSYMLTSLRNGNSWS